MENEDRLRRAEIEARTRMFTKLGDAFEAVTRLANAAADQVEADRRKGK